MTKALALVLAILFLSPGEGMGTSGTSKEAYRGWPNTYLLSNGEVEVRVLTDVGPRIIDVRRRGGENLFYVRDAEAGGGGEKEWTFRGGWRLWVSPERKETTYALDNAPCAAEVLEGGTLRVSGRPEPESGLQKIVEVSVDPRAPRVQVVGRLRNAGDRARTYAAWSLPVLRPGGRAFAPLDVGPLESFDSIRRLILWSYARFSDPRYTFGDRLVQIDQAAVKAAPAPASGRRPDESKIGTDSRQGWAAYLLGETLFLKRWTVEEGERSDGGATTEIYSSHEFLELEHLGPLRTIAPGEEIRLAEQWDLIDGVSLPRDERGALEALDRLRREAGE